MTTVTDIYPTTARILHWMTAALVLALIPIGIAMGRVPEGALQNFLFDFHRSLGVLLMPIVAARVIYRATHAPPPLPADIPAPQRFVASFVHAALYILLVVQPLVGWFANSAYGAAINVFWLFELPPIWPKNEALSERLFSVHRTAGFLMAGLICAHIGGALFHYVIKRDRVLQRMWG